MASTNILALQNDLEKRWESMAEERVEEEEAYRFLTGHDLAQSFKGNYFPSVYLMRQGNIIEIKVATDSKCLQSSRQPNFDRLRLCYADRLSSTVTRMLSVKP